MPTIARRFECPKGYYDEKNSYEKSPPTRIGGLFLGENVKGWLKGLEPSTPKSTSDFFQSCVLAEKTRRQTNSHASYSGKNALQAVAPRLAQSRPSSVSRADSSVITEFVRGRFLTAQSVRIGHAERDLFAALEASCNEPSGIRLACCARCRADRHRNRAEAVAGLAGSPRLACTGTMSALGIAPHASKHDG